MAYGDFKVPRITVSDNLIKCYMKKCLKLLKIEKGLASLIYNFFERKSSGGAAKREFISTQQLAEQLKNVFKIYTHRCN